MSSVPAAVAHHHATSAASALDEDVSMLTEFSGTLIADDDGNDGGDDDSALLPDQHQEVTHEQHLRSVAASTVTPASSNRSLGNNSSRAVGSNNNGNSNSNNVAQRMISSLMRNAPLMHASRKHQNHHQQHPISVSSLHSSGDCLSVCSDSATAQSMEGLVSLAGNFTVASCDTVKVSNRTGGHAGAAVSPDDEAHQRNGGKPTSSRRWKGNKVIKSIVGAIKTVPEEDATGGGGGSSRPRLNSGDKLPRGGKGRRTPPPTSSTSTTPSSTPSNSPPTSAKKKSTKATGSDPAATEAAAATTKAMKKKLDRCIRGRTDGLDVLSLCGARHVSLGPEAAGSGLSIIELHRQRSSSSSSISSGGGSSSGGGKNKGVPKKPLPWGDDLAYTFTGDPLSVSTAEMVSNMLWTNCDSSAEHLPVIILEGFVPGSDDRWRVPIEESAPAPPPSPLPGASTRTLLNSSAQETPPSGPAMSRAGSHASASCGSTTGTAASNTSVGTAGPPSLARTDTPDDFEASASNMEDGGAPVVPVHRLWPQLWGSPERLPCHSITADMEWLQDDDPLLQMAAEHSIPIDLDENTFCVSERAHMETVHNFVSASLAGGRFRTAIFIFTKLLKGIENSGEHLRFLRGATLHNIGVLYMWQGQFELAVENFHLAVQERTKCLPKNHPDIAVSMVRKGMAQFALGRLDDALFAMELAIDMVTDDEIARAKILNNMGVIYYQQRKYAPALKQFTSSLEIQRRFLEGPLRRDGMVYDAATTLGNMGKLYLEKADYSLAYYVYEEALLLQTTIFRKDHELVLASLQNLALTRAHDSQNKKALQILQGCLRSQNTKFGKESKESIETVAMMGYLYARLNCHEDALKCFTTVRKWQKANLPGAHPSVQKIKASINEMEQALGTKVTRMLL